ncbi:protein kinase-like domain-containing protein [Xylariomycetidae sp. FL2044]|nr:protein kinase-like domain-containing protein [Xylariomycetidae sp. FL2044]
MAEDPNVTVTYYHRYLPPGVKRVIASGSSAWIGEIDDYTVLKYTLAPDGDKSRLEIERKLHEIVGHHPRIIQMKAASDIGLYLERAVNGNVADYIFKGKNPPPSIQRRLAWCREAAEAVSVVHDRGLLHCDIQPTNLLLDEELHVKLTDFQGKHLSPDGTVLLDGGSGEPTRFYCPRDDPEIANIKTELFALGCTIYFIIKGHGVYPDIIDGEDEYHEKVQDRFAKGDFPQDSHVCAEITSKCWRGEYNSAKELLQDIVRNHWLSRR